MGKYGDHTLEFSMANLTLELSICQLVNVFLVLLAKHLMTFEPTLALQVQVCMAIGALIHDDDDDDQNVLNNVVILNLQLTLDQ